METIQQLIAQQSAARARLLWELLGIPGEALTTISAIGDWTIKDLLVHLADDDRLYVTLVSSAISGTITSETIDLTKVNKDSYKAGVQDLTLDAAVEALIAARSGFCAAIEIVSEKDLDRLHPVDRSTGIAQGSIRSWARCRFEHEAEHLREVSKWRRSQAQQRHTGPNSILLAALRAARVDLLDSIALVSGEERAINIVTGAWTLKDVIGHVASWDGYFIYWLHSMIGKPVVERFYDDDEQTFNNYLYQLRRDQRWEAAWDDFQASHQVLAGELQALSQEDFERPSSSRLIDFEDIYHLAWSVLEHDLHHAALLRAGINAPLPKWLLQFEGQYT